MDCIEGLITEALQEMSIVAQQNCWSQRQWTSGVKQAIVDVGDQLDCLTAANGCNSYQVREWLYDVVWYKLDQDYHMTDVPLVAESEWDWTATKADFEKLLVARAKYRVMVFEQRNESLVCTQIAQMKLWIKKFQRTQPGDRYMLAGWCGTHWYFEYIIV